MTDSSARAFPALKSSKLTSSSRSTHPGGSGGIQDISPFADSPQGVIDDDKIIDRLLRLLLVVALSSCFVVVAQDPLLRLLVAPMRFRPPGARDTSPCSSCSRTWPG